MPSSDRFSARLALLSGAPLALLAAFGALGACGDAFSSGDAGATPVGGAAGSGASGADGGAAAAGAGGIGGSVSTGGTAAAGGTVSSAEAECTTMEECKLIDDCCTCEGLPEDETAPICNTIDCIAAPCVTSNVRGADPMCEAGRCVAGFACDHIGVSCGAPPPICTPGYIPSVISECWSGECVPLTECAYVATSQACIEAGLVAVVITGSSEELAHCVTLPAECGSEASCACMGDSVCLGMPCSDVSTNRLHCALQ